MSPNATPEAVELATFLRAVVDECGMTVTEVQGRFTKEHFGEHPIPSVSTVYKRLNGEALANAGRLVDAIVDVCTPPERLKAVREKAAPLKAAAVISSRRRAKDRPPSGDCVKHLEQLAQAQQRVITLQDEVARLAYGRQDSE